MSHVDTDGKVYLINTTSEASAGWYDADVARVLLGESENWRESDPDKPAKHTATPAKPPAVDVPPAD